MDLRKQYGPWALIAGGSQGVGTSFAPQLGRQGFNLVLAARQPGRLQEKRVRTQPVGTVSKFHCARPLTVAPS